VTVHADALQTWTRPPAGRRRLHAFRPKSLPFSFSEPLCVLAGKNARASLPTITLDVLLLESVRALLPGNPHASRAGDIATHLLSKTRHASLTNPPRIPRPPKLACPRPARAASDNVGNNHGSSSKVTSPIFQRRWIGHTRLEATAKYEQEAARRGRHDEESAARTCPRCCAKNVRHVWDGGCRSSTNGACASTWSG